MNTQPLRILLVEDNPGDARLIREALADAEGSPFDLTRVARLDAALAQLDAAPFDVVLLDLSLPDSQGLKTVYNMLAAVPSVPIVVMTGLDDQTLSAEAVRAGAQDYLIKGRVDTGLLVRTMRYAVERQRAKEERVRLLAREQTARVAAEAARKEIEALYQAMKQIIPSLDLPTTLNAILDNTLRLCEVDFAGVALLDADGAGLHYEAVRGAPGQAVEQLAALRWESGQGLSGLAVQTGQIISAPDADRDPRWVHRSATDAAGLRSSLVVPMRGREGVIGVLSTMSRQIGHFTAARERLLAGLADQAALAIVHAREIAERRRAEEDLRRAEARFTRLAQNAQDIIYRWELRPARHFSYIGPVVTRILGYSPEELYADPDLYWKLARPDDRHLLAGLTSALVQDQITRQLITVRFSHRDGHLVWLEVRLVPVLDDALDLIAIEGIARDVTERKQMEEQIARAQRLEMAGQVAGQVAHDFNNLLAPLVGYPELIKMRLPADHPAIAFCDDMLEAAHRMVAINEDLLTLGRRGQFEQVPTDLNRLVEQVVAEMPQPPATLSVRRDLAPDLLPINGSAAQLMRVLSNLVANARDAMGDAGRLTISTENVYVDAPIGRASRVAVGEYARLAVADTGVGIPPDIRAKIFDAFFTTKHADRRRGSGLGLSIVQAIVEDHRGYVDFESEVGQGTTFSLYLPVNRQAAPEQPDRTMPRGSEAVLVVDDDEQQRLVMRELLGMLGYSVDAVASGEAALAYLRERTVDLVILDMIMPRGLDGAETYSRLIQMRPGQRTIILSGSGASARVRVAQALGAGAFLRKPVALDQLARAVRTELARGRSSGSS